MADNRDKATDQMKTWKANRGSQVYSFGLIDFFFLVLRGDGRFKLAFRETYRSVDYYIQTFNFVL